MSFLPSADTRDAVLRHPFFLAGLAVVALLALTAGALVIVDSVRGSGPGEPTVVVSSLGTATVGPPANTPVPRGVFGTTKSAVRVQSAPGSRTPPLGTLPADSEVKIDGRTTDTEWLRIVFPPNTNRHGWIDASSVDVTGDPTILAVATAEPPVVVAVPTQPPAVLTAAAATPTPGEPTPTLTPTPGAALPDLVVGTTPTLSGRKLFVSVVNQGSGEMKGDLVVAIFNIDGTALLGGATVPAFTLPPGRSIDVSTGYTVDENQTVLVIVDPNGTVLETDDTNNRVSVALVVPEVPTEPPAPPPPPATQGELTPVVSP